ncbi:efflux RND transporter permease subunit [Paracoccus sp. Z118]|uniref:efflux RND transporter permease subunit n=1 Tax=Paracoccus sp. Z118 TaxID=2851017 RepID=UPI001C2CC189|nr:efflux RND transporter permease subunit [Paracoccus sp. Z118]MBV0892153.1 efflux RND transporter permease subunit [Paracoccus sp. Z118]
MFLTRISVGHPVFATMMMVAIVILGLFSWQRLPVEQLPNVDIPVVAVVVAYDGASPEAVENDIIQPIEDSMATISGIDTIQSTAQAGQAMVLLQFDLDVTSAEAMDNVRDKLSGVQAALPDRADAPTILRFDPSAMPIISIAVSSQVRSIPELTTLTEDMIVNPLRNVSGVGSVSVVGGLPAQVDVTIDPERLAAQGIPVTDVMAAINDNASDLPAGEINEGATEQSIQIRGSLDTVEDFRRIIVGRQGGQAVYLADVANVSIGPAEATSLAFLNGEQALAVDVMKVQGANTVQVARDIVAAAERLSADVLPGDVRVQVIASDATAIEDSVEAVQNMLIEGAILSVVIVFLFLNSWRSTIITGLTLPISIIGTMFALYLLGFSLNIMTLMALSLSVGILIDDAIVVRENIMRHLHMGKGHRDAALEGTREIGLAVMATTLSIVAVFLPVAFMEGIMGRFFLQFGVTVSVAVMISLFVAFTLDPMLSSVWYDPDAEPDAKRGPIGRAVAAFNRWFDAMTLRYVGVLRWALRHRLTVLAVAFGLFIGSFPLIPLVGTEFLPSQDNGKVTVTLETLPGSSLEYTGARAAQIDAMLRADPAVASTYSSIAGAVVGSGTANAGTITVTMVPHDERAITAQEFAARTRETLQWLPGLETVVSAEDSFGPGSKPVEIIVYGDDTETLARIGEQIAARLAQIDGLADIDSSMNAAQPQIAIQVDNLLASELGISLQQISGALTPMMSGTNVAEWTAPDGESYDVVVRLDEAARSEIAALGNLPIGANAQTGEIARLDQVAAITRTVGQAEILRQDLDRRVTIDANIAPAAPPDVLAQVGAITQEMVLPDGYRFGLGGDAEALAESGASAGSALLLAVIFIYLVLASQFGSFLQPVAIMFSLPLSLIGVVLGLLVGGSTLNMMSMIGFIMLMGLVVKNAILLVDNANQQVREGGANLYDALVSAGRVRFRPIIMTTLAMILGMTPLALNLHQGSSQNAPMAHAVIGGLISSTLLTLVVVPVMLTYLDSFGRFAGRFLPRAPRDDESGHAARPQPGPAAE